MSRSQRHGVVIAAAFVLLLAGCSAPTAPSDPTDAAPGETPSVTPGDSASPTPGATESGDDGETSGGDDSPAPVGGPQPVSVLPLDCGQLVSLAHVQAGFESTVAVGITEDSPPPNFQRVDFVQAGGLFCTWSGDDGTGLQLGVIADAADNYAQRVAATTGSGYHDDTLGDDSHVKCAIDGTSSTCSGDILIGDYWLYAVAKDSGVSSESTAFGAYSSVLTRIVGAVAGAGAPRGHWTSTTAGQFDGSFLCASPYYPAAVMGSGTNGFKVKMASRSTASQSYLMSARAGSTGCTWALFDKNQVTFAATDGGGWAFDRMAAAGVGKPLQTRFEGTIVVCPEMCTAYIKHQGALITVVWLNSIHDDAASVSFLNELADSMGV